jgi:hypothetical protein
MRFVQVAATVVALTVALCPRAYAPIYGEYPGLRSFSVDPRRLGAITRLLTALAQIVASHLSVSHARYLVAAFD